MNSDLQKKWMHYEKKWRFRDFYFNKILRRHGIFRPGPGQISEGKILQRQEEMICQEPGD